MSLKTDIVGFGIIGVGAYLAITNIDKITGWLASQFAAPAVNAPANAVGGALNALSNTTGQTATQTGNQALFQPFGWEQWLYNQAGYGVVTPGQTTVGVTVMPGGTITLPNGQTISSSATMTNTSGNQQGSGSVNVTPTINQSVGNIPGNVTNTASTFNPNLPPAVAWAQPGSPAWVAYYGG